ncbi:uncharacterized protein AB675_7445 [Cyphellophora attinorum]|uniref:C2H2-type domain-containing protein n=1 Tax=Cyphellophora attinorum TaxID=1664694 RepID=A0A0N0NME7_9EURO|nr:uncharacterized protein AB675_7445 [Phialophora attinorum]KPI40268.1 hypothetical protein AB675_7445 [Phialophora attinorum]
MNACPICENVYKRPEHLRRHLQSHSNERPFVCAICDGTFQRSDTLRRHQKTCIAVVEEALEPPLKKPAYESQVSASDPAQPLDEWHNLQHDALTGPFPDINHIAGWLSSAASPDFSDPWGKILNLRGDDFTDGIDDGSYPRSLGFLDNFTRRTGLVESFECGSLAEREAVRKRYGADDVQAGDLPEGAEVLCGLVDEPGVDLSTWMLEPLALKTHEIVSSIAQVSRNRPEDSSSAVAWSVATQSLCAKFFSPTRIRKYVDYYWALWHPNVNLMHRPTFEIANCRSYLVATMCILGALVSPNASDGAAARMWLDAVEEVVFTSDDLADDDSVCRLTGRPSCRPERVRALQAAYMVLLYQTWEGSDRSKRRVRRLRFSQVVAAIRDAAIPNAVHPYYHGLKIHEFSFADFAIIEELIRVTVWVFLIDTAYTLFNNSPPRMVISEMKVSPACPEVCFQAETAESCLQALQAHHTHSESARGAATRFDAAFDMLYRRALQPADQQMLADLGPLNLFAMTSTLHALIFHFRSSLSCRGSLEDVKRCLDNWHTVWQVYTDKLATDPRHALAVAGTGICPPEQMWKRIGFMRHAGQYWTLAKLMIEKLTLLRPIRQNTDDNESSDRGQTTPAYIAESTRSEVLLDKYDETSMRQVNDLIAMLQKTNI